VLKNLLVDHKLNEGHPLCQPPVRQIELLIQ
jgi:hypothetical protein